MKTRALLLALPLLAASCVTKNRASVELQAICMTTDDCKFQATCTNTFMGEPALDISGGGVVWIPIQVENQLPNNQDVLRGQLNTNDAHIDGFVLDYKSVFGKIVLPTNQYVPAAGTTVIAVDIVPPVLDAQTALAAYAPTTTPVPLQLDLRLRGYLDDGTRFETGNYPIAIQICTGCIPACPSGTSIQCGGEFQLPRSCK